jgi:hypothetical protein
VNDMADADRAPRAYPQARAIVAAVLFLGWLAFLVYLVTRTDEMIVVSRPQILVSDVVVVAQVRDQGGQAGSAVAVKEVVSFKHPKDARLAGADIKVADLPKLGLSYGYAGPGDYILPLVHADDYRVTPLPTVPGFVPTPGEVRIYRATADTLAQVRDVTE